MNLVSSKFFRVFVKSWKLFHMLRGFHSHYDIQYNIQDYFSLLNCYSMDIIVKVLDSVVKVFWRTNVNSTGGCSIHSILYYFLSSFFCCPDFCFTEMIWWWKMSINVSHFFFMIACMSCPYFVCFLLMAHFGFALLTSMQRLSMIEIIKNC